MNSPISYIACNHLSRKDWGDTYVQIRIKNKDVSNLAASFPKLMNRLDDEAKCDLAHHKY